MGKCYYKNKISSTRGVHLFYEDKRCRVKGYYGFACSLGKGKNANCYVVGGVVWKV